MFRGTTLKSAIALVATLALLAAGASIVRADSVDADGDTLEAGNNITASCLTETDNGVLKLTYDSTGSNPKHYVAGTALTISSVVTNAGGSAITSAASNSTNNVAAIWNADGQTMTIPITTVVPANTPGGTYKVDYTVAGAGAGGGTVSRSRHFNVTVTCTPPSNTAPTVSVTGVTSGASYNKGSVPAAVCSVTDAQDGPSTFPATLSAITGPYAADGIGSQTASCSYTDAGPGPLSDTDSVSYNIVDSSAPVITPTVTGTKGSLDWYTSDVTVQWTVTDAQSTVAIDSGCAPSTTFTADTTGVTSSCTAHSAGGSASDSVTVKLDKTAPTGVALAPSGTAGVAPWFTSNVEVITNGTDATSGVSCTDSQPFSAETSGTTVNGFCTNGAGLTTNASPLTLKIDKTGPSAELNVTDGTPGGTNGWYTSDVTVTASGTDSISGPPTCSAPTTLTDETAGTSVTGACTNAAGLSTDAVPLSVKIDKSNPTASLSAAGTLFGDWYTSPVIVTTSGGDDLSDPTVCTAEQTFSDDGADQVANGSCTNDAGLTEQATPIGFNIDQTAPTGVVLAVTGGTEGAGGWYTTPVSLETTSAADLSGVTCTTSTPEITTETAGITVTGSCTDGAGHTTEATPITIKIDMSGPSAETVASGTDGADGWYTSDVSFVTGGEDTLSGIVSCTSPDDLTAETAGTEVTGSCINGAGITTTAAPLTIRIDKTAPTDVSTVVASGIEGLNGWYTSAVTFGTTGTDALSGVNCESPADLTGETGGTDVAGSCTNGAGLSTTAPTLSVKIDLSGPSAETVASGTAGLAGWYTSNVSFITSGIDDLSGILSCESPADLTGETLGTEVNGSCTNSAGITTDAAPLTVKIDKSAPTGVSTVVTSGQEGLADWYTGTVALATTSDDDLISGILSCTTAPSSIATETAGTTVTGTCTNGAGLQASDSLSVKVDLTGPTATQSVTAGTLGTNGWYKTSPTVSTTGNDSISNPTSCDADEILSDGADQTVNGSCTNAAGLTTNAAALTLDVDTTAPTGISFTGGPAANTTYYFGLVPAAPTCTATDATSGLAGCAVSGYSSANGTHTMTATATDNAGNTSAITRTYTVSPWTLKGFYQPVDMSTPTTTIWNTVKGGSTVPLKFELFAGSEITDTAGIKLTYSGVACSSTPSDEIETTATGGTSLRYDSTGGQFIYNWKLPTGAGSCYRVTMTAPDSSTLTAFFKTK